MLCLLIAGETVVIPTTSKLSGPVIVLMEMPTWLCLLNLYGFSQNLKRPSQGRIDRLFSFESDEAKAPWATGILVHHERSIDDTSKLLEKLLKVALGGLLADSSDENLRSLLLLIARNRTFWVNLVDRFNSYILSKSNGPGERVIQFCHQDSAPSP